MRIGATAEIPEKDYAKLKSGELNIYAVLEDIVLNKKYIVEEETFIPHVDDDKYINDEFNEPEIYIKNGIVIYTNR